jgi:hypothetical protein
MSEITYGLMTQERVEETPLFIPAQSRDFAWYTLNGVPRFHYDQRGADYNGTLISEYEKITSCRSSDTSVSDAVNCAGKNRFNFVDHVKESISYGAPIVHNLHIPDLPRARHSYVQGSTYDFHIRMIGSPTSWFASAGVVLPTSDDPDQAVPLLHSMLPDVFNESGAKVSILNFIAELGELKRLASVTGLHSPIESVSDNWLSYNFGLKPLISDISSMLTLIDSLDDLIDKWNEMAANGTVRNSHRTITSSEDDHRIEKESYYHSLHGANQSPILEEGYQTFTAVGVSRIKVVSKASLYYRPKHIPASARLKIKSRAWGLDNLAGVVWEAIPFSWLIDYFLHLQDAIDGYAYSDRLFNVEILGAGISHKIECTGMIEATIRGASSAQTFWDYSRYIRQPIPGTSLLRYEAEGVNFDPELTGQRWSYIAAVTAQRR